MAESRRAPWKSSNPRKQAGKKSRHLSAAKKLTAKARARRAGRRYPNLVDNMAVASRKTKRKPARKRSATKPGVRKTSKKTSKTRSRKPSARSREKNSKGGLTAAGRKAFANKDGAHLRPGAIKKAADMTPQEMRRKGSWAVRFYGREKLPPLLDDRGRPTRYALSAHAWGEPVPKTVAAARRIAAKGERLLARYKRRMALA